MLGEATVDLNLEQFPSSLKIGLICKDDLELFEQKPDVLALEREISIAIFAERWSCFTQWTIRSPYTSISSGMWLLLEWSNRRLI